MVNHDRVVDWVELHAELLFLAGDNKVTQKNGIVTTHTDETASQDVSFYLYRADCLCNSWHSVLVKG